MSSGGPFTEITMIPLPLSFSRTLRLPSPSQGIVTKSVTATGKEVSVVSFPFPSRSKNQVPIPATGIPMAGMIHGNLLVANITGGGVYFQPGPCSSTSVTTEGRRFEGNLSGRASSGLSELQQS